MTPCSPVSALHGPLTRASCRQEQIVAPVEAASVATRGLIPTPCGDLWCGRVNHLYLLSVVHDMTRWCCQQPVEFSTRAL